MDDLEALRAAGHLPDDEGSQEVPEIIQDMQKPKRATKGSTSKTKQTPAQAKAAAAKKEKEAAKKKAEADKKREAARLEREKAKEEKRLEREAAKKAKADAKAAGPDLSGLVPAKPSGKVTLQNVPLDALDGIDGGDPVDKAFTENVKLHGVLQPIRVRVVEDDDGKPTGRYNIIFGKRRSQAARANGHDTIPAIVEKSDDANDYVQGLAENYSRSNNAIEEHRMVMALLEWYAEQGITGANDRKAVAAIAKATGMTTTQIKHARDLGRLVPELMTAVEEGAMASWSAVHASRMPVEVQRTLVDTLNQKGHVTVEDVNVARRYRQHEGVVAAVDEATATGQNMFDVPDNADDAAAEGVDVPSPVPTTRVAKVAEIVRLCRAALAIAETLSSKSQDEKDAVALLTQIVDVNLTTSPI
jgi:hypothetical protein